MQSRSEKYDLVNDPNEILISVSNPTEVKGTLTSYTVYALYGSDISGTIQFQEGNFDIKRRYSDFDNVRNAMMRNWPGCYIPPLPRKKFIGNNEFLFIESRRKSLDEFCKQLSLLKHLWYSRQFQVLLRGKEDIEKNLKQIGQQNVHQITEKYNGVFKYLSVKECDQQIMKRVDNFYLELKKISGLIETYKQSAKSIVESFTNDFDNYMSLLKTVFPEYQKGFLSTYLNGQTEGKLVFGNTEDKKLQELVEKMKKIVEDKKMQGIYLLLQKQQRQVQTFLQIIRTKNSYCTAMKQYQLKQNDLLLQQNKLNAGIFFYNLTGKQSLFKSIIKSDIQQQKKAIQLSIDQNKQKIKAFQWLCDLMTIILGSFQVPRFQQQKMKTYYQLVKQLASCQIAFTQLKEQLCDYVIEKGAACYGYQNVQQ